MCYFLSREAFSVVKVRCKEVADWVSLKFYIYSLKNDCKLPAFIVDHVLAHTIANSWLEYFWLEYIRTYREARVCLGDKACQVSVLLQLGCDLSSYSAMDRVTGTCTCCFSDILLKGQLKISRWCLEIKSAALLSTEPQYNKNYMHFWNQVICFTHLVWAAKE